MEIRSNKAQISRPLVTIITVNYNAPKHTLEFLESVKNLSYPFVEVIVVDNSSTNQLKEIISEDFHNVKLIKSNKNVGFAGGNNLGILHSTGEYLFFLNNDTIVFPEFIEPILEIFENNPRIGIASPKVLFEDGKTIQYAGAKKISSFTGRGKRIGLMEYDNGQRDYCCQTDLGHGAALIVPRRIVDEIGNWPEIYFLYYEEHDWCEQIKRAGYIMYYIGITKIIHKEAMSTGGSNSPLKIFYLTRNRLLFMRRNNTGVSLLISLVFFVFISIPKNLLTYLIKGQFNLLNSYIDGIIWHLHRRGIKNLLACL